MEEEKTSSKDEIDLITKTIDSLSLSDQTKLFKKLGITPHGWLYAYRIPVENIKIQVIRERRGNVKFKYDSKPGEWCLLNMGSTAKLYPQHRLNYFRKFHDKIKPIVSILKSSKDDSNKDLLYCIPADIAWETQLRTKCFLGGWDIGGNTNKNQAYIKSTLLWKEFLLKKTHSIGPTENNIIPTTAFNRIKAVANTYVYPYTSKFVRCIEKIIREETLELLGGDKDECNILRRDTCVSLEICRWEGDDDNLKETQPWDHLQYVL